MAATAQALSGGRVILGIGAGWNEEEYRAYGWPFPPAPVRIAQLAEAIELIRAMWAGGPASYQGQHYQIAGAHCESRPDPIPPVMVGGHGEKHLLRVVARHADWWNYSFRSREIYAHKQAVLEQHCRDAGRDYAAIIQVIRVGILIAETERELERLKVAPHVRPMEDMPAGRHAGPGDRGASRHHRAGRPSAHRALRRLAAARRHLALLRHRPAASLIAGGEALSSGRRAEDADTVKRCCALAGASPAWGNCRFAPVATVAARG